MKTRKIVRFSTIWMLLLTFVLSAVSVSAYSSDLDTYKDALADVEKRHDSFLERNGFDSPYTDAEYSLFDITGDGKDELVVRQITNKHSSYFWVYGNDGIESYFMGEFECDADFDAIYGYVDGILFRESYKGMVSLYLARYDGASFSVGSLYDGSYNRDAQPPTVEELSAYYDASKITEKAPAFESLY